MASFILFFSIIMAFGLEIAPLSHEAICRANDFNEAQVNICIGHPQAVAVLYDIAASFKAECEYQFINDQWNCSDIEPPILRNTSIELEICK